MRKTGEVTTNSLFSTAIKDAAYLNDQQIFGKFTPEQPACLQCEDGFNLAADRLTCGAPAGGANC